MSAARQANQEWSISKSDQGNYYIALVDGEAQKRQMRWPLQVEAYYDRVTNAVSELQIIVQSGLQDQMKAEDEPDKPVWNMIVEAPEMLERLDCLL